MNTSLNMIARSLICGVVLYFGHANSNAQITCQSFYERRPPFSYTYYIGDFSQTNPGQKMSTCKGVGFGLRFTEEEGMAYMRINKFDIAGGWPSESFNFPDNPEHLKTQNIPLWAYNIINEYLYLIQKHRPKIVNDWTDYLAWKRSGSGGQDDPKALGRGVPG